VRAGVESSGGRQHTPATSTSNPANLQKTNGHQAHAIQPQPAGLGLSVALDIFQERQAQAEAGAFPALLGMVRLDTYPAPCDPDTITISVDLAIDSTRVSNARHGF
jgi:hypothetical protein